jgi:hypothetical protein
MRATYQVRAEDDGYFHRVAASRDLEEARGNVLLWRVYVLERTCVLTVALLCQQQRLSSVLQEFIRRQNISPFREFQPRAFLAFAGDDEDGLTASVAQFELALSKAREGESGRFVVRWDVEPGAVLKALAEGEPLSATLASDPHVAFIDRDLPGLFTIERTSLGIAGGSRAIELDTLSTPSIFSPSTLGGVTGLRDRPDHRSRP